MMKHVITIAALLILSVATYGQGIYNKAATNVKQNRMMVDSVLGVPRDTSATNNPTYQGSPVGDSGRIAYKGGRFWGKDSVSWKLLGSGATDTAYLSARIDAKVDSARWKDSLSAQTLETVTAKGNTTPSDIYMDYPTQGRFRFMVSGNSLNRIYSMSSGGGAFRPMWIGSGGLVISDIAGSLVGHNGVDALQVQGSGKFTSTVEVAAATADEHAVRLGQLKDTVNSLSDRYMSVSDSLYSHAPINVEVLRRPGISDDSVINRALAAAGKGNSIELQPWRTYTITRTLYIDSGQTIIGNGATLYRANSQVTTLSVAAAAAATSFTVASVPTGWRSGDQLQVYTDSTANKSIQFTRTIFTIVGNVITVSAALGNSIDATITTWPIGASVRRVYPLISVNPATYDYNAVNVPYSVRDLTINGNKANNNQSFYWFTNAGITTRGLGAIISKVAFKEYANECIVGHGFTVQNCTARRIWGSFVHFSGSDSTVNKWEARNGWVLNNYTDSTNLATSNVTGHSEGVITLSYNGGWFTATGNRFYNGANGVLGTFSPPNVPYNAGSGQVVFANNFCENFATMVNVFGAGVGTFPRNSTFSGNTFVNCGATSMQNTGLYKARFINNSFVDGTTVSAVPDSVASFNNNGENWGLGIAPDANYRMNIQGKNGQYVLVVGTGGDLGTGAYFRVDHTNNLIAIRGTGAVSKTLVFETGPTEVMRIHTNGMAGIRQASPSSYLHVAGSFATAVTTVTGSTTLDATHKTVRVNNSGSATITLPTASTCPGRIYTILKVSGAANDVIVSGASKTLTLQGSVISVQSNSSTWDIIGSHAAATTL